MKKLFPAMLVLMAFLTVSVSAKAHMLWLNADNYTPAIGEDVYIQVGFGHEYPVHQHIKPDRIRRIYVIAPDGKEIELQKIFTSVYKFTPEKEGTYITVMQYKKGFMTITEDGKHLLKSKEGVDNVKSSFQYIINAKALVMVGGSDKGASRKTGVPLEIIPLTNPSALEEDKSFKAKVLLKDQALSGTMVEPVHTFENHEKDAKWEDSVITDKEGEVEVKINAAGQWTLKTDYSLPYPDKSKADEYQYATTITFGVPRR
ncbi:MAG: DUF4198 domain-containing protein [bacterium]